MKGLTSLTLAFLFTANTIAGSLNFEEPKDSFVLFSWRVAPKTPHVVHLAVRAVQTLTPTQAAKQYARSKLSAYQFTCLDKLWTKESHWNYRSYFASSGAYGIPQAVPGSKMASKGSDWRTNPITQVRWGLSYISARYGSPCVAWNHSLRYNWY